MIVVGIDTSLRSTGYAVIEKQGSSLRALDYGTIKNKPRDPLTQCVKNIFENILRIIEEYRPDVMSVEAVIYAKNALTTLALGQARGAVLVAAAVKGVKVFEYEPRRMKRAVCGNALAEKRQIQMMVKSLFSLDEMPQNDAADALGLALCHVHSNSILNSSIEI